jgi:hypothetical protein
VHGTKLACHGADDHSEQKAVSSVAEMHWTFISLNHFWHPPSDPKSHTYNFLGVKSVGQQPLPPTLWKKKKK